MIPDDIRRLYSADFSLLESIADRVRDILLALCKETGYAYGPRPTPVKTLESAAEKLESGRYAGWADLDDLVACSIIAPTRTSEQSVLEYLSENFQVVEVRSRASTSQSPAEFRFGATRFIGRLRSVLPDNQPLARFKFEVQVRTAFEHAWSVTTHALAYKSDRVDWRMDRMAAQLKASVEQLDMLVEAYEHNAGLLAPHAFAAIDEQRLILDLFQELFQSARIPQESAPYRWGQFAKNIHSLLRKAKGAISRLTPAERPGRLIEECRRELDNGGWSRPLSLYQFALGSSVECGLVNGFAPEFYALVTPALEERFPRTSSLERGLRCRLEWPLSGETSVS